MEKLVNYIKSQGQITLFVGFSILMGGIITFIYSMGWAEL